MIDMARVGVIGAGRAAAGRCRRIQETGRARVAAVADPAEEATDRLGAECGDQAPVAVYRDYAAMLAEETLDACLVASPPKLQEEHVTAALEAGLHVLCERPMGCSAEGARRLIAKAREQDRVLMAARPRHHEPAFRYMRAQLLQGAVGPVQFIHAIHCQDWLHMTRGTWRHDPELSGGGQLLDAGNCFLECASWAVNSRVASVCARIERFDIPVDVNTALSLTFANGALGSISIAGHAPAWHEDLAVIGGEGALHLRHGVGLIQHDARGAQIAPDLPRYDGCPASAFVQAITGGDAPEPALEWSVHALEVVEAALESAETGRHVEI